MTPREALNPHLKSIYEIICSGFDDYQKLYPDEVKIAHDSSCRAHNRNCHIRARAAQYAALHSESVRIFESRGLQGILINQLVAVLFKKLNSELRPRNNPTKQIDDYLGQREIAEIPAVLKLVAGYTEDQETGERTGVFVTRPSGNDNRWELRLSGDEVLPVTTPLFVEEDDVEEVDIIIRREPGDVIPIKQDGKDGVD